MGRRKSKKEAAPAPPPPSDEESPIDPPPLAVATTNRFERDLVRMAKRGLDREKIRRVIRSLSSRTPLPASNRDHELVGNWVGWRECHVAPDWLLIYRVDDDLILGRTRTHSDLFG